MENESTETGEEKRCQRCGTTVPAIQECCVACLVRDLRLIGDEYFDATASFSGRLGGSDFTVLEEIGRGGMGVVFRARQTSPARDVAIKVLQPHLVSSPEIRRRLFAEAAAMAEMNHAGILPLYASGEHDGQPWIAMKLATRGTLSSRLSEWTGQWREAAELLAGLADAAQHAHERGLIHRDIKPGNVLFDENGKACLADFGLVKWVDADASDTLSQAMLGTPAYLAPEVARAGARAATTASDVYGLGAMFYELLTGAPPFKGAATAEMLRRIAAEEPPAPRRLNPDVPRDLEIICQRALAREPADRYPSAAAFGADLLRWLDGRMIMARPFSAGEKFIRWVHRNPLPASLAAGLAATLTAGGVALWIKKQDLQVLNTSLDRKSSEAQAARADAEDRVDFMTRELPELLIPLGRLDVLNGVFRNLESYYVSAGTSQGSKGLAREAEFRIQWAQILWPQGLRAEAGEQLGKAVALGTAATAQSDAGPEAWLAYTMSLRRSGEHSARADDYAAAYQFTREAVAAAEEGLERFPGNLVLRITREDAFIEQAYACNERGDPEDIELGTAVLADAPERWRTLVEAASSGPAALHLHARRQQAFCYFERGRLALHQKDHEAAIEDFYQCHACRAALANDFKNSAVEKRFLGTACNRMADALIRQGDPEEELVLPEVERYLKEADRISKELAAHDPANQRWQADWALSAMALGQLEYTRNNKEESLKRLEETLERLETVTVAAVPSVHEYRANACEYLARIHAEAGNTSAAMECWMKSLESTFTNIQADPLRRENHLRWITTFYRIADLSSTQPDGIREKYLRNWLARFEPEVKRHTAPWWWQLGEAALHRRLAEICAADPARAAEATEHNRQAFLLRSNVLLNEPRVQTALVEDTASAAKKFLRGMPTPEDRLKLAERLIECAAGAAKLQPSGSWRVSWTAAVCSATASLMETQRRDLAGKARRAFFVPVPDHDWNAEEQKSLQELMDIESSVPRPK